MTSHTHQASTEAAPDLLLRAVEALTDAARDGGTDDRVEPGRPGPDETYAAGRAA